MLESARQLEYFDYDSAGDPDIARLLFESNDPFFESVVSYVRDKLPPNCRRKDGTSMFAHSCAVARLTGELTRGAANIEESRRQGIIGAGLFHEVLEEGQSSPLKKYKQQLKSGAAISKQDLQKYWKGIDKYVDDIEATFRNWGFGIASLTLTEPPIFMHKVPKMRQCAAMTDAIWFINPLFLAVEYADRVQDMTRNAADFEKLRQLNNWRETEQAYDMFAIRLGEVMARTRYMLSYCRKLQLNIPKEELAIIEMIDQELLPDKENMLQEVGRDDLEGRAAMITQSDLAATAWYSAYFWKLDDSSLRNPYRDNPLYGNERNEDYRMLLALWGIS